MSSFAIKILGCSVAVASATCLPVSSFWNTNESNVMPEGKVNLPLKSPAPKPKRTITLTNSSTEGGKLSWQDLDKLLETKNTNKPIFFKDLGMTMGGKELSKDDLLVSPWQNSRYYLAQYDRASGGYKLGNGKIVKVFRKDKATYENLDHVDLTWKYRWRTGSISPDKVVLGTCAFKAKEGNEKELKVIMQCFDALRNGEIITGIFTGKSLS